MPTLEAVADDLGTAPAAVAMAFALVDPTVASVLFGATSAAQVMANAAAPDIVERLTDTRLAVLRESFAIR